MMRCITLLEYRRRGCLTRNEVSGLGSQCLVWAQRCVGLGMAAEDRSGESRDRRGSFSCEAVVLDQGCVVGGGLYLLYHGAS